MIGKSQSIFRVTSGKGQWRQLPGHCTVSVSKSIGRFDDTLFYLISFILLIRYWFKTPCMGIWVSWIDILNVRYLALWPLRRFALKLFVNSCERDSDRHGTPCFPSHFFLSPLCPHCHFRLQLLLLLGHLPGPRLLNTTDISEAAPRKGTGDSSRSRSFTTIERDTWMWWRLFPRRGWQ